MSEFSISGARKKNEFSSSLLSDLYRFCFSVFSHPLYFSYFIFFSPYLLKLLSFLSPLFVTTALLLLALLTFSPNHAQEKADSENSDSEFGFVFFLSQSLLQRLRSKGSKDEETGSLEGFEAYLVMFQESIFEEFEPNSDEDCSGPAAEEPAEKEHEQFEEFEPNSDEECSSPAAEEPAEKEHEQFEEFEQNSDEDCSGPAAEEPAEKEHEQPETNEPTAGEKRLEILFQETTEAGARSLESLFQENKASEESLPAKDEEEEEKAKPLGTGFEKTEEEEESRDRLPWRSGSKVTRNRSVGSTATNNNPNRDSEEDNGFYSPNYWSPSSSTRKFMANSKLIGEEISYSPSSLGSYGSMRKEKEWRRTLACKLFEERHNGNGSEGMDMLWETYEAESDKKNRGKKKGTEIGPKTEDDDDVEEEDEDDDDEMEEGKLCCLRALKFSAGKMNMGMGRPSLVKITKAIKGFGWLHHHARHGRKGHH